MKKKTIGYVQCICKSKSKPIQPRNSNLNYIQFLDLKTKRKKTITKTKTITLSVMGTRPISLMVADFSFSMCLQFRWFKSGEETNGGLSL